MRAVVAGAAYGAVIGCGRRNCFSAALGNWHIERSYWNQLEELGLDATAHVLEDPPRSAQETPLGARCRVKQALSVHGLRCSLCEVDANKQIAFDACMLFDDACVERETVQRSFMYVQDPRALPLRPGEKDKTHSPRMLDR